jgi:transmembrane sensor
MEYSNYSINGFVEDQYFRKWVRHPDEASNAFWGNFLRQYPGKAQEVSMARDLVLAIASQVESGFSSQANEDQVFQRIKDRVSLEKDIPVRRFIPWPAWAAAAAVVLLMGWWFVGREPATTGLSYETNLEHAGIALTEKVNDTSNPMLVTLEDSSTVVLKPKSKISFARNYGTAGKREVYLSGEAFFEVVKNPQQPFFVYANELVTKVLGTSFNVRAFQDDKDVTVKVRTGRVSVAVASAFAKGQAPRSGEPGSVLLLPNQQVVLSRQDVRLVKSLVEDPSLLSGKHRPADERFVFSATPAAEVFKVIAEAYGLPIEYDTTSFANCQFTANLTDESLFDKLDIICKSIEATYQIVEGKIVISGKGCN